MSLVKQLTTVSEFEKWQAYFGQKQAIHTKSDWYAAQTAWAIFVSQGAKNTKVSEYLLKYDKPKPKKKKSRKLSPEEELKAQEEAWKASRAVWLSMVGIDPEVADG